MIDVIWYNGLRGNWDHGLLLETFDKYPTLFIQHNVQKAITVDRAIVIVVGRPEVAALRQYLDTLKSGVVILTSEEDGFFDWKSAIPPHLDIWTAYFTESKREIKERILLGAPNRIKDYKINSHLPKKYLWSFIGQIQNPHRQQMVEVLKTLPDGFLHVCPWFAGQHDTGIEYQAYLDICCQSKFVLCPSGSQSADSFRLYESMECGAMPITDMRCPRDEPNFNYWEEVYSKNGVICLNDWDILPIVIDKFKNDNPEEVNQWWFDYKKELEQKLLNIAHANTIL